MGYYSWNEHFGRHAFFQPAALKELSHNDKKTVNFAKYNIHGLLSTPLLRLYIQYKGGHVKKDLLNKTNIPYLDLETWGCPKDEQLKQTIVEPLVSCGFHLYSPLSS